VSILTLDTLAPGAPARVAGFAAVEQAVADRLLELGFDEGAEVETLHRAPPAAAVALVGNPNAGKTSLFNALTGSRQKVGNYPGVTVERKAGRLGAARWPHAPN
jgi:Fe2+ transport system protein FeoA